MNQTEYRKRLRDQRAQQRDLAAFQPSRAQAPVQSPAQAAPAQAAPAQVAPATTLAAIAATPNVVMPEAVTDSPAIIPVAAQSAVTQQQLRDQAKSTATLLAGMPQDEYQSSLQALERSNPLLYSVVVDELHNLAAATDEGDGFDLSDIAGGPAAPFQGGSDETA